MKGILIDTIDDYGQIVDVDFNQIEDYLNFGVREKPKTAYMVIGVYLKELKITTQCAIIYNANAMENTEERCSIIYKHDKKGYETRIYGTCFVCAYWKNNFAQFSEKILNSLINCIKLKYGKKTLIIGGEK